MTMTESLAGRFESLLVPHWSYKEIASAFQLTIDQYIYFGSYPGAFEFINDESRWKEYIRDSLIETVISRDLLLTTRIDKPILMRNLFKLAMSYSGQIMSYQKMLGRLQDVGNATTLAHYLELLNQVMVVAGLEKFSDSTLRSKKSSPKFQPYNLALKSAISENTFAEVRHTPSEWGRYVENAVGAELLNHISTKGGELFYWNDSHHELDFVYRKKNKVLGIEVKSGVRKDKKSGLLEFKKLYPKSKCIVIGNGGISFETFFNSDLDELL